MNMVLDNDTIGALAETPKYSSSVQLGDTAGLEIYVKNEMDPWGHRAVSGIDNGLCQNSPSDAEPSVQHNVIIIPTSTGVFDFRKTIAVTDLQKLCVLRNVAKY